ncbi:hypothetical protein JCM4914_40970 [Streptomyces platensis subsp. malvinus]
MNDEGIAARFDGRASVEFILTGFESHHADRITWIATELGYTLSSAERYGRGHFRVSYMRDDSPSSRQRAQAAMARVQASGSWLAVTTPPWSPAQAADPSLITPLRAAQAARNVKSYNDMPAAQIPIVFVVFASGFFALTWATRGLAPVSVGFCLMGILCLLGATLGPRYRRNRHEANLRLLDSFRQQQAARFGVPPPAPPPPPPSGPPYDPTGK